MTKKESDKLKRAIDNLNYKIEKLTDTIQGKVIITEYIDKKEVLNLIDLITEEVKNNEN